MVRVHQQTDTEALTAEEEYDLWLLFKKEGDNAARERLVSHYLPYARVIAAKLFAGRHHEEFEFDEYLQFATVGLMESLDRFDPERGVQFKTFTSQRMIGAILNGIEFLSEKQQQIAFRQRLNAERRESLKDVSPTERTNPDQLFRYLADVGIGMALGYLLEGSGMIDTGQQEAIPNQYDRLELRQLQQRIRIMLNNLPELEQHIIKCHYLQNIPFQEIAKMYGLTKGRISQIHRRALTMLRYEIAHTETCDIAW